MKIKIFKNISSLNLFENSLRTINVGTKNIHIIQIGVKLCFIEIKKNTVQRPFLCLRVIIQVIDISILLPGIETNRDIDLKIKTFFLVKYNVITFYYSI